MASQKEDQAALLRSDPRRIHHFESHTQGCNVRVFTDYDVRSRAQHTERAPIPPRRAGDCNDIGYRLRYEIRRRRRPFATVSFVHPANISVPRHGHPHPHPMNPVPPHASASKGEARSGRSGRDHGCRGRCRCSEHELSVCHGSPGGEHRLTAQKIIILNPQSSSV